jgi:hypothetical protein
MPTSLTITIKTIATIVIILVILNIKIHTITPLAHKIKIITLHVRIITIDLNTPITIVILLHNQITPCPYNSILIHKNRILG